MVIQKWIDDYVSKPAFEVASSVILIDSSENDEEDVIEDSEILRDFSASQPQAHMKLNTPTMPRMSTLPITVGFGIGEKLLKDFKSTRKVKCI